MRRRAPLVLALVVVLALGVAWGARALGDGDAVDSALVTTGELALEVEVTGRLRAVETAVVSPPQLATVWEFKIARMAAEGATVEPGDPVVSFDVSDLENQLRLQQAERDEAQKQIEKTVKDLEAQRSTDGLRLEEARARLRRARLKVDRPGDLAAARELAEARLDLELAELELTHLETRLDASRRAADAQLAALEAQRDRAERRLTEISESIEQMTVPAPRRGTVIYVEDWQGNKKQVGDSCWRGEPLVEVPDLRRMLADGEVDEVDVGRVEVGQPVSLRLDAHPDVEFTGSVASIWKTVSPRRGSQVKVARVEVELDRTDTRRMRPGMRFRGRILTERIDDVLLVPAEAVFVEDRGPVVYREGALGWEAVVVELGRRGGDAIEVVAGLRRGDRVALRRPEGSS